MLRYVYDEAIAKYVAMLVPSCRERGFGKCRAMGVLDEDGVLIGGVVYHDWNPESGVIQITCAAITPRWLSRETLKRIGHYAYFVSGCQMVTMMVEADDERVLRILAACGFVFIKVPRLMGRGRDAVLALLTYEDWVANRFNGELRNALQQLQPADAEPAGQRAAERDHAGTDARPEPAPANPGAADAPDADDAAVDDGALDWGWPDLIEPAESAAADAAGAGRASTKPARKRTKRTRRARKRTRRAPAANATAGADAAAVLK